MSIIKSNMTAPPPAAAGGGGVLSSIGEMNSLLFDGSSFLKKTDLNTSTTIYTFSCWLKFTKLDQAHHIFGAFQGGGGGGSIYVQDVLAFSSGNILEHYQFSNANSRYVDAKSTAVFRDPSAWYHVVLWYHSGIGKSRIYVNNELVAEDNTSGTNQRINADSGAVYYIGNQLYQSEHTGTLQAYMADVHFIDNAAWTPDAFGELISDTWVPRAYDPSAYSDYGQNGFHLDFSHRGGHTIQTINNVQLNTSSSSGYIETAVPANLSTTNEALAFVNNGYLEVSPFVPMSGDFTLEAWISRKSGVTAPMQAFGLSCSSHNDHTSFYFNDGHSYTTWWWPSNYAHEAMDNNDNSWEHVAWVRENGTVNFYRNGVQKNNPVTMPKTVGADWIKIGNTFQGGMNHIRVSNSARYSGASIADWQNTTHNFTTDSNTLLLITDQNNIDSTTFVDQSGSGDVSIGYDSSGNNNHWDVH